MTISNEDPERVVKILMLFFRQFNSVKFDESFLNKGFDSILPVNLTIEHEDLQMPTNIENAFKSALDKVVSDGAEIHISKFCKSIDLYRQVFGAIPSPMTEDLAGIL